MKTIELLNLGYSDAQNYMQRGNKQMFSDIFVRNNFLDEIIQSNKYFLIGEKGTGKTAYATFLNNTEYKNSKSILKFINGTDYEKFYELKKSKRIDISGYVDIWKTILLLMLSSYITEDDKTISLFNKNNIKLLMNAIDEYYNKAFSPEIVNALKIVDNSEIAAKLICQYAEAGAVNQKTIEFSEHRLQMNLFYIYQKFSESLKSIKLIKNITLFIDGIDIRPVHIPYNEYLDCIKGLATACWTLNTELFTNIRDTKGQLKIVLLLRPDIFNSLNLQNSTNKLVDNSVYLEWRTTYIGYPTSALYKMANKLLSYDQNDLNDSIAWEKYFTWRIRSTSQQRKYDTAFMEFLKISLSRPRDIQRILKLLQDIMIRKNKGLLCKFDYDIYNSDEFQNEYSQYFLSSLRDQLAFYYSDEDYKHFTKFFDFFDAPQFSYNDYKSIHDRYIDYILDNAKEIPNFVEEPKTFLQLLYDSNVIAAIENNGEFYHFSYREKSPTNISPEVPYNNDIIYRFHYGMYKKGKFGRY